MRLPIKRSLPLLPSFTLVELLIVVSIITIITGAVVPSFSNYLKGQSLKNSYEQFKNDLRSAQNKSLTGSKYDQNVIGGGVASPGSPTRHWAVKWWNATNRYRIYADSDFQSRGITLDVECSGLPDSAPTGADNRPQSVLYLPSGVTFSSPTRCLFFKMSDGSIMSNGTYTIVITDGTSTKTILWNTAGLIGNP